MADLTIEPFRGYRVWSYDLPSGDLLPVADPNHGTYSQAPVRIGDFLLDSTKWGSNPWKTQAAECWSGQTPGTLHANRTGRGSADCLCGFWAVKTLGNSELIHIMGLGWRSVLGEVELTGHVLEGDRGWRGQFARPIRLFDVGDFRSDEVQEVARKQGLPIMPLDQIDGSTMVLEGMRSKALLEMLARRGNDVYEWEAVGGNWWE